MRHQPVKQGQITTPGISAPTLSDKCVGSLTSPANHITLKMQETGTTVFLTAAGTKNCCSRTENPEINAEFPTYVGEIHAA